MTIGFIKQVSQQTYPEFTLEKEWKEKKNLFYKLKLSFIQVTLNLKSKRIWTNQYMHG